MKLFWKIFSSVLLCFVAMVFLISYMAIAYEISNQRKDIVDDNRMIGRFVSKDIEVGYLNSEWPFESLKQLSLREGFLFWWVVRDDGIIHLADKVDFMGTYATDYFPEIANMNQEEEVLLNRGQAYGLFAKRLAIGNTQWLLLLGFSLKELSEIKKKVALSVAATTVSTVFILGIIIYFVMMHFTRPIEELTTGVATFGKGNLSHRVEVRAKDELGMLANSFNNMAEELQKTTVSRDYVDSIIRGMIDALIVVDPEARIRTVNSATCQLLGYQEKELIGQPVETVFASGKQTPLEEINLQKIVKEGELKNYETSWKTKRGAMVPVLFGGSVMKNEEGRILCIICTARDITERKEAEEKLQETMAELERSNTELEQFAYVASHDLQEPLRMVGSFTELLARRYKGNLDADADEFIAYVVDGASRMQKMINALLAYSRVGTRGKRFAPTDCQIILQQALDNLQVAIKESGAEVTHEPLPTVTADASQLLQLFQNLLANAIKFRSDQPPRIHIGAKRKEDAWLFSVQDNGIGIAEEFFDRIFIVFQRLCDKEQYPGTGIGLSICRKIVARHGGHIWVESELGKGATFYFTIPTELKGE
jgi:PAS domain S-box-containing protein